MLADAGLLIHVFDDWEGTMHDGMQWEPDVSRPEAAASLIFGGQREAMGRHPIPLCAYLCALLSTR